MIRMAFGLSLFECECLNIFLRFIYGCQLQTNILLLEQKNATELGDRWWGAGAGFDWHHHAIDSYIFASVAEYDEDKQGKTCRSGF